ncbi:hypothetical protein L9F63_010435, partial [Diploptera punctata]
MSDGQHVQSSACILSLNVKKLGHHLEEIRVRSLNNIISKLDYGIISTDDLIIQKDLALKLLGWFDFETCPEKEKVLNLILLLLKADREEIFHKQIAVLGDNVIISKLSPKVTPILFSLLEEISAEVKKVKLVDTNVEITSNRQNSIRFLSSQSNDVIGQEISQRSTREKFVSGDRERLELDRGYQRQVEPSGATINTVGQETIVEQPEAELQSSRGHMETAHQHCHGFFSERTTSDRSGSRTETHSQQCSCFQYLILPWQSLISTDCHVLLAVEQSLTDTIDLNLILHTCRFFTDVMLQDFPAEVFLQRPGIFKMFLHLLDSDKRVCETVIDCLYRLTSALHIRIHYYSDPAIANLKQEAPSRPDSNLSTPSYRSAHSVVGRHDTNPDNHSTTEFHGYEHNVSSNVEMSSEDSVLLQLQQVTLPQYCLLCLFHVIPHIAHKCESHGQNSINYSAMLTAELASLLAVCVRPSIWKATDTVSQEVIAYLNKVFKLLGEVLEKHRNAAKDETNRITYLQLLALTRKILVALVPVEISDVVLDVKLRNSLAASLFDLSVITLFPTLHSDILIYVKGNLYNFTFFSSTEIQLNGREGLKGVKRKPKAPVLRRSPNREEAVSRLTWLMSREERAFEKLPDFSSLRGLLLNSVCLLDRAIDLGRNRMPKNVYTNSLSQVLELLHSEGIEPVVRRSALTQICVMLEDYSLHEFNCYPDSVIPCIGILKSVALHSPKIRFELSQHTTLFSCIVRAIYLYNGDDRMRPDSSVLLCLLLYSDFIIPVPEPADDTTSWHRFSLPDLIARNVRLPFMCHTHWNISPHTLPPAKRELLKEEGCSSLLRLCWNVEWFNGLETVLNWPAPPPNAAVSADQLSEFSRELRLTEADLNCLKITAMSHRCKQHLFDIQSANSHEAVTRSIICLYGYLSLNTLINKSKIDSSSGFLDDCQIETSAWWQSQPWQETFKKFLTIPPVSPDDQQLLVTVLQLLNQYLNVSCMTFEGIRENDEVNWITKILKDPKQPLPNLLTKLSEVICGSENQGSKSENICREMLQLVKKCSTLERNQENFYQIEIKKSGDKSNFYGSWIHIISAISQNITFSDTQHFYNLAFLDWMLSCLAHLTGKKGWSKCTEINVPNLWSELISSLVELVTAFHCGKGGASIASFMGLSITRSAVLCMNHLLCEMQNSSSEKGWETIWLCSLGAETHAAGKANLLWLPSLWLSRDAVTRAAALQLVAGFCSTRKGSSQLLSGLPMMAGGVWGAGLSFLLEHEEASLVREQAALLLTNLSSHSATATTGGATLSMCDIPVETGREPMTGLEAVLSIITHCNLFGEIAIILSRLYMNETLDPTGNLIASSWDTDSPSCQQNLPAQDVMANQLNRNNDSNSSNGQGSLNRSESLMTDSLLEPYVRTTPALVRNICWFMLNLFSLSSHDAVDHINNFGLIRLLYSCLTADVPVDFGKDRSVNSKSLCLDIMEMYAAICSVLSKCVALSEESHTTFLQMQDCIHSLLALLDPSIYCKLFLLFSLLLFKIWCIKQGFEAVRSSLFHCGHEPYIESLISSIQDEFNSNLCNSALSCLVSLLSFDMKRESKSSHSLQNIFDSKLKSGEVSGKSQGKLADEQSPKETIPPLIDLQKNKKRTFLLSEDKDTDQKSKLTGINIVQLPSARSQIICENDLKQLCLPQGASVDRKEIIEGYKSLSKEITGSNMSEMVTFSSSVESEKSDTIIKTNRANGEELCKELVCLYGIYSLQQGTRNQNVSAKKKILVVEALMSLLAISKLAKNSALNNGLLKTVVMQLRELHIKLALESVDNIIRTSDKKRVGPLIREVSILFGLLTNFLSGDKDVKESAAELGLADLVHKLWVWCCAVPSLLEEALKLLSTFVASCPT